MRAKNEQVIFLSAYVPSDGPLAVAVCKALKKRGIKVWFLGRIGMGDHSSARDLRKALTTATWYVVLVSDDALTSPWFNFELGAALGQDKKVLPVFLSQAARRGAHSPLTKLKSIMAQGMSAGDVAERVLEVMEQDAEQAA